MTSRLVTGFYLMQVAILDSENYPMGTLVTPNSPVNGTVYSPLVVEAPVEFAPPSPTYADAFSYAGQKLRGRRPFGATDYGIGTITLSEFDDVFDALVMGYTLDTATATAARIRATNAGRIQQRRFMVALTGGAVPEDSAVMYETTVLLNVYFQRQPFGMNQGTGQNPNNVTYNVYANTSNRTPWGQLLSAATVAVDGDSDTEFGFYHDAPYMFTTYVDDGSATSFTLPYTPSYTEVAGASNIFYKEGVDNKAQVSAINGTGNKTVNITAGTAADKWVIWFPSAGAL